MRIMKVIKDSTDYGEKKRDVILTTGESKETGYHIFAGKLLDRLSTSENDIVIAGLEPMEQFYPLLSFLELVKKHTEKKVWLVTNRDVTKSRKMWNYLVPYVEVVEEANSGRLIDLPKSIRTDTIVLWEE